MALMKTADFISIVEGETYYFGEERSFDRVQNLPPPTQIRCIKLRKGHCIFATMDYEVVPAYEDEETGEIYEGYTIGESIRLDAQETRELVFKDLRNVYKSMIDHRMIEKSKLDNEILGLLEKIKSVS